MFDYLFKGLVTVNNKHDNSTHKETKATHSYDTTFLVIAVIALLVVAVCYMVYKSLLRSARRRVAYSVSPQSGVEMAYRMPLYPSVPQKL
jgi:hypothetical protein